MTMKSQTSKKRNKNEIKQTAKILYLLKVNKLTQKKIADELNVTLAAVNRVINGKSKSIRISNYIKERLGA